MTSNIKFEKVTSNNFEVFFYMVKKLAEYEKQKPLNNEIKTRLKKDICSKKQKIEAYLSKNKCSYIGYLIFYYTYSSYLALPTLYIEDIFILKEYRRNGFGYKMFKFCVEIAKEKNCGRIEWCVYNWNKTAINFYNKIEAEPLDKKYYRIKKEDFNKLKYFNRD